MGIPLVRAGVWKPRTRPNTFEGIGEEALRWMKDLRAELGVAFAIEVASPQHVELALQYGIELLWIGARSTVNPFTVQEIAEALAGTQQPVLVKNPVNPDLSLWLGAIERLEQKGISQLGAIHRGFSSYQESRYRNLPLWQLPIELKRQRPDLPLLCDPSHIAGDSAMIQEISQKALDLNYDGLMVETHPRPTEAWSDAKQQLTPAALQHMLQELRFPEAASQHPEFASELDQIRAQIDLADRELIEALHRRMELVARIGQYKKDHNLTILDLERWNEIFKTRPEWAKALGLKKKVVKELYKLIHTASIERQHTIFDADKKKP